MLPQRPLRQFVPVMPFEWHHRLARDAELESKLLGLFVDELLRGYHSPRASPRGGCGSSKGADSERRGSSVWRLIRSTPNSSPTRHSP
jgi:hypothetical protein